MLDFFETLCALAPIASPSGYEQELALKIAELARPFADEITTDAIGNLTIHKSGAGERVLLAAHMDTIGMIATHYDEQGFLRFGALGWLPLPDLQNLPVRFVNGVEGVLSYETKPERKDRKPEHFYIDIGAEDADTARKMVPLGTAAVYIGHPRRIGAHRIMAPYLDNRVGVVLLLMLLSALPETDYDLYCTFTVQEEVGMRGARCAAYEAKPRFSLVIDSTDAGDVPESETKMDTKLGAGSCIKIMDHSILCHPKITQALQDIASKKAIPYQNEIMVDGGTDAGEIHLSRSGVITGGISVPIRYAHSPYEILDLRDVDASFKLLHAALKERIFF